MKLLSCVEQNFLQDLTESKLKDFSTAELSVNTLQT